MGKSKTIKGLGIPGVHVALRAGTTQSHKTKLAMSRSKVGNDNAVGHKGRANNALRAVRQYTLDGVFVAKYSSIKAASEATGVAMSGISLVANGNRNSAGGFVWKAKARNLGRPILQYNLFGQLVAEHPSLTDAAEAVNVTKSAICQAARQHGACKSAGGFLWRYKE